MLNKYNTVNNMQTYTGNKIVKAKPMTRLEYNQLRGWTLPADEEGSDQGYLVEYQDGGKSNLSGYTGYVSWSPKTQFDNAYVSMGVVEGLKPFQTRVLAELVELEDRIKKLEGFLVSEMFKDLPLRDSSLLRSQVRVMVQYQAILQNRIECWEIE